MKVTEILEEFNPWLKEMGKRNRKLRIENYKNVGNVKSNHPQVRLG